MKNLIVFVSSSLLTSAFLYPLFFLGAGREVSWLLVAAMAGVGIGGIWVLVKYRKSL
jgi:hypothetical protein